MDSVRDSRPRVWRKLVKKMQRKRKRQHAAFCRDEKANSEQALRELDPTYQLCLKQQTEFDEFQRLAEEERRADEEEAWLRREAIAQRQFHIDRVKRQQQAAAEEAERLKQTKELKAREAEARQRREGREKLAAQAAKEFEATLAQMQEYLDNTKYIAPPSNLLRNVETRPGQKLCEFYERTNCCRFGPSCTFNHRRPILSKILLIHHFFTHSLLQHSVHKEYENADAMLELSENDLCEDYEKFFKDVILELRKFGNIINFRTVRNVLEHLRGNVFVEYADERAALRAFINLQGRYYASKRLNVEFSNIRQWRGAVCGMSLTHKCARGLFCGYLHLFRNPENIYNTSLGSVRATPLITHTAAEQTPSWNDGSENRNWRWSESPETDNVKQRLLTPADDTARNNGNLVHLNHMPGTAECCSQGRNTTLSSENQIIKETRGSDTRRTSSSGSDNSQRKRSPRSAATNKSHRRSHSNSARETLNRKSKSRNHSRSEHSKRTYEDTMERQRSASRSSSNASTEIDRKLKRKRKSSAKSKKRKKHKKHKKHKSS